MSQLTPIALLRTSLVTTAVALSLAPSAAVAGEVTFTDVAADVGLSYVRTGDPALLEVIRAFEKQSLEAPLPYAAVAEMPSRADGSPGLAVFDYDMDDDLDLYVTNGPGSPNSLFQSQLSQTGELTFVEVAAAAGVEATEQNSSGTCFGDMDNDGDEDLFVMGLATDNKLFVNNGDGTFTESPDSGLEGGPTATTSCSLGDVDGNGFIDLVVANSHNPTKTYACFAVQFELNEHNQLFMNQGDGTFKDESKARGIEDQSGYGDHGFQPGISWVTAMADIDLDGDADILFGDDQCGLPHSTNGGEGHPGGAELPGIDRGFIHVMINDGTGNFVDKPMIYNGTAPYGQNKGVGYHMGLAFGDLDCNGTMDLHVSNVGDYIASSVRLPYLTGDAPTRWYLGNGDGTFSDPGIGDLNASPFGWGNAIFDYDNDGDQDILAVGGVSMNLVLWIDNPGMLLSNDGCSASFTYDAEALSADYTTHNSQALATADLDRNGYVDVITTSNWAAPDAPRMLVPNSDNDSVFDATAYFVPIFMPTPEGFVWTQVDMQQPELGMTLELSSGGSNGSVSALAKGSPRAPV